MKISSSTTRHFQQTSICILVNSNVIKKMRTVLNPDCPSKIVQNPFENLESGHVFCRVLWGFERNLNLLFDKIKAIALHDDLERLFEHRKYGGFHKNTVVPYQTNRGKASALFRVILPAWIYECFLMFLRILGFLSFEYVLIPSYQTTTRAYKS